MNTLVKNAYLLIALLCTGILTSQNISGTVSDQKDIIPFANVIVKDTTNTIISGTTTTDQGTFSLEIEKGIYLLEISYLGYETFKQTIEVKSDLDLGNLVLKEDAQALEEVVIKAEKRIIERKIDRLIFNVEKSLVATGGNGLDVLRITPGVQLQNNILSIIGKGATQVMINGRLSPLAGDELISFLSGFSANDIVKIEIITNPPAQYDAAGNGGLINIVLKKGIQNSWKNTTTLSYNQNKYNFATLNNNIFYNKNKISMSASINAAKGAEQNLEGLQINYPDNFWEIDIEGKTQQDQISGRFLIDYAISKNTTVGIQYLGNTTQPDIDAETSSAIFDNNSNLERSLLNKADNNTNNKNNSINLHTITELDSVGKKIMFDADYFVFNSNRTLDFFTEAFDPTGNSLGKTSSALNISDQEIENFNAKIDVTHPLQKINLSYGIKASFTGTSSGIAFFDTLSGSAILDPNQSTRFKYNEDVLAAYISGNTDLSDKLKMQMGLRFEDTKTMGFNIDLNQKTNTSYSKLFPSLYLSYTKNENNSFGFAYGKRINRPNFRDLNPFRFYINDNSYSEGNPFLQPSFSDNIEVSHVYKNNLNTRLSLNVTTDGFGVFFNTDVENQNQIITRENYFKKYTYRLEQGYSYNKLSWFKSQNSANVLVHITKLTKNIDAEINNGIQFYAQSNNTFILNEQTKIQTNAWYSSFHNDGLFSMGEMFHLSFGLQHEFKNKITLSMLFSDILNTGSLRDYNSTVNNIEQSYRQNQSSRNFRISLSYNFGNNNIKVKNRGFGNDEEQRRSN